MSNPLDQMTRSVYTPDNQFRPGESYSVNRWSEAKRGEQIYHSHTFLEICYVAVGSGYHLVGENVYEVSQGDLFMINYSTPHVFYKEKDQDSLVTYNMMFMPKFLDNKLQNFQRFHTLASSYLFGDTGIDITSSREFIRLQLSMVEQEQFGAIFSKIYKEYTLRQTGYSSVIRAYLIELITKITRSCSNQHAPERYVPKKISTIENAINHLRDHYNEPISLEYLANKTYFSKSYLCKLFKEVTGETMSQYVQRVRIDEACKMMKTTDKSISQISEEVGFSDYKAFHITFKKYKGVSPNKYRKGE
jgi:AraC family L-rhamnose operon transcriptional activator RhaR